jgi:hypothetical protein
VRPSLLGIVAGSPAPQSTEFPNSNEIFGKTKTDKKLRESTKLERERHYSVANAPNSRGLRQDHKSTQVCKYLRSSQPRVPGPEPAHFQIEVSQEDERHRCSHPTEMVSSY